MKLSVIVGTRNRGYAIAGCLDSIAAALANAAPIDAEIVVVDNGSTDNTADVIKAWASTCKFPVQSLVEPRPGLSCAHNLALRSARGELLAFTDDDCRLHKDYVNDLLRYDAAESELVVRGGRIELGDPTDLPHTINTSPTRARWSRAMRSARYDSMSGKINGCNMTMRRAVVDLLGSFDEDFGSGSRMLSGGDTELFYRAYAANVVLEYVPDMTVFHYHGRKTREAGYELWTGYMIGNGGICVRYFFREPDLVRPFYWDCKNAIREIITGTNTFLPNAGFSHKHKVACAVRGAIRYIFMRQTRHRRVMEQG